MARASCLPLRENEVATTGATRARVLSSGSVTPHTDFEGIAYILSKNEGGRHNPFYANYRPQFYFRTTDGTGVITLPEGTEMVMPGDTTDLTFFIPSTLTAIHGQGELHAVSHAAGNGATAVWTCE